MLLRKIKSEKFKIILAVFILQIFLLSVSSVFAADNYKPYLHEPQVPEHPKVKLYGTYSTNLFPGAATYDYPIEVPKGTGGLQPILSITYNSQSMKQRPGILGSGWSLTQNYIYRDANSTLGDTNDDEFKLLLGGASYDLVYNPSEGVYHTKLESFLKIQNLTGGTNTYGIYWIITSKDGAQFRFGYSNNSELASNTGRSYALRWSLDQVKDNHGNKIFYSYSEDPNPEDKGTSYLSQITYNNDQQRKINFTYETNSRTDSRLVYEHGNLVNESRRLASINILASDNLVRKYSFEYVNLNPENSLSSLSKIKYIGSDGTSILHQVSFDYYSADPGFTKYTGQWISPAPFSDDDNDFGARLVDLNNDGFVDLIKGRYSTSEKKAWLNNKNNNWTDATAVWASPEWITKTGSVDVLANSCTGSCGQCKTNWGGNCPYDKCYEWGCGYSHWTTYGQTLHNSGSINGYNTGSVDVDYGTRFTDFNNDGFADILHGGYTIKQAFINNGSGWVNVSSVWAPPTNFEESNADIQTQLIDFNGDGRTDILQSFISGSNSYQQAYINNGYGWTDVSSTWIAPTYFSSDHQDAGTRVEDINGDGLPDVIQSLDNGTVTKKAWLNTGSGWNETSLWQPPILFMTPQKTDNGVRFVDLNGDGLPDIVENSATEKNAWINNGTGWTQNNSWQSPEAFIQNSRNMGRRLADVNGDGLSDIIVAHTNSSGSFYWSWIKNSTVPYTLKKITNELGGTTSLVYNTSTQFNNTGNDSLSDLGFNVWIVKNVIQNNSASGSFGAISNYTYNYSGGSYSYKDFEFRGFSTVNETLPDKNLVMHYFHQDDARKGKEYRTEVYSSSGSPFSKSENFFNITNISAGNDLYYKVFLLSQSNYFYDGSPVAPNITNVSYAYDNYGNVLHRNFFGDVNITGDEKYERYAYAINSSGWIVGNLDQYLLFAFDNSTKVREAKYSYDNLPYSASPIRGDLTEVSNWLDTGGNQRTKFAYDSFGNVIRQTDPLGHETTYTYGLRDTTFTYPDKITNALFHTTDYSYDLGAGNLQWQKQNDVTSYFYYDTFGRITKEVQPFDSFELPTKNYAYFFDGSAPEYIKISQRTTANKTYDTYFYYDGFGNFIQLKKPADNGQQIVKNFFYDGSGRVVSEQNPYFASFSTSLSNPSASVNATNYTYDTLGRVAIVKNPDGTNKTINFDHYTITTYDENSHRKSYVLDSFGRIKNVLEYNNDPVLKWNFESDVYNTSYDYDTTDNLIKITDSQGNVFSFTYDSLGRRTALSDPDLGNWTYIYDLSGNLIQQFQNGGGNLITGDGYYREYDSLNQLIIIRNGSSASSPIIENYSYDPFGMRVKIERNDSANTKIYTPFKELMRIVNSSGAYDFTYIYQDGQLVARQNPDGSKYFYHPDHLGSTSLITDLNGNIVEQTFYSPFGETLGGGTADLKLYTSQFRDSTTGQYMLGNSVPYKPEWGLRLKPDFIIQQIYNPQNLNRYSYALNNPYRYKDPTGKIWVDGQYQEDNTQIGISTTPEERFQIASDHFSDGNVIKGMEILFGPPYPIFLEGIGGYGTGAVATGTSTTATASNGINGAKVGTLFQNIKNANAAEKIIQTQTGGTKTVMNTGLGKRVIDALETQGAKVAHEVKVGLVHNTQFVRNQILKDIELLQKQRVDEVVWNLFTSPVTGKSGVSTSLQQFIEESQNAAGVVIKIIQGGKII